VSTQSQLEIEWLRLLVERRLQGSAQRISELQQRAEDRDDQAGVNLLLRMLALMVSQTQNLTERKLRGAVKADGRKRRRELDTVRSALIQLEIALNGTCTTLVAPPERDVTALIQPFVRLAKSLTGHEGTELIFESGEHFEYEVWADAFEEIRDGVETVAPSLEFGVDELPPFALVTYPGRADSETLLHAVIAHEVVHVGLVRKREEGDAQVGEAFISRFRHYVKSEAAADDETRASRLESWLNECLADSLALRIVGPAYFFALLEYLLPTHISDAAGSRVDESHPPPAWRVDRLCPDAESFFGDRKGRRGEAAETFERFLQLVPTPPRSPTETEIEDQRLLEEMIGTIDLDRLAGKATYPIDRFRRDLPLVWDKLEQGIAPVERVKGRRVPGRPAEDKAPALAGDPDPDLPETDWSQTLDWRSILNGGYLHYLHKVLTPPGPAGAVIASEFREKANSLVRGSIELSELHRRMIELREEFQVLGPVEKGR